MKSALLALMSGGCILGAYGYSNKDSNGFDPDHPTYAPPMFEDYVSQIARSQDLHPTAKIPRNLEVEAPVTILSGNGMLLNVALSRLDDSRICIVGSTVGEPREKSAQQIATENLAFYRERSVSFRGISSLAAEKGRPLFPVPTGATQVDAAESLGDEVRDFDNRQRGTVERKRVVTWQLCAPRPTITEATTFIAVTAHFPDAGKPEYKSILDGSNIDKFREEMNQEERLKADALVLVAITDGRVDLNK